MLCSVLSGRSSVALLLLVPVFVLPPQHVAVSAPIRPGATFIAPENSPPKCEGELCRVSLPSVKLVWNSPYHLVPLTIH